MTWEHSAGVVVLFVGMLLRYWAIDAIERDGGWPSGDWQKIQPPPKYTTSGPYRWLRHPMYRGSELVIVGLGMLAFGALLPALLVGYVMRTIYTARQLQEDEIRSFYEKRARDYDPGKAFLDRATEQRMAGDAA